MVRLMDDVRLVGFDALVRDIRDGVRLCQPIVAFGGDERMYLARRLDWVSDEREGGGSLTLVDPDDVTSFGTLIPVVNRVPIGTGVGVLAVGNEFADAIKGLGDFLWGTLSLSRLRDNPCWIGLVTSAEYDQFRARVSESAAKVVDEELGNALTTGGMSERGLSASRVLRKSNWRRTDVAIRELATPLANGQLDLFRRRLTRYSIELGVSEGKLRDLAQQHMELTSERMQAAITVSHWRRYAARGTEQSSLREAWLKQLASALVTATLTTAKLPVLVAGAPGSGKRFMMERLLSVGAKPRVFDLADELGAESVAMTKMWFERRLPKPSTVGLDVDLIAEIPSEGDELFGYMKLERMLEEPRRGFVLGEELGAA